MNTRNKWGRWFWGLFFLACAGILIASKLGIFTYHIGFWTLIFTLILAAALIKSLVNFSIAGSVFSLAFLAILYAKPLGITRIVPWTLLGAALLLSIGLSLVLQPLKRRMHHYPSVTFENGSRRSRSDHFSQTASADYESSVNVNVRMGSTIRYVQSDNFQYAFINLSMGEVKVYFDQATIVGKTATIELNGSMGDIDLFVPKNWNIQAQLNSFIVDVEEVGEPVVQGGPVVSLVGNFKMGDITIHRI
ncbi:LiaF transmembrane domain-containing protein [Pediococcus siamensis]|uniref:LiaF transmembrane domain-containing protein n=1 Tax=Pediococcus siamensis TaxID=381829 RepID=UPI0039A01375